MNWTKLLKSEMESAYHAAEGLVEMVEDGMLEWKPSTGTNWMTTGQVLHHITNACGAGCKGFATGDWGLPEGQDASQMSAESMLPPAEKWPTIGSVAEAQKLLAEDKLLALEMVDKAGEEDLAGKITTAPWDSTGMILGQRFLQMIHHLASHKSQLFYYLKLQGKEVTTHHLWGM